MKKVLLFLISTMFSLTAFSESYICKVRDSFDGINDSEYKIDIYPKKTSKNTVSKLNVQTNGYTIVEGSVSFARNEKSQLLEVTQYSEVPAKFKKGQCGHIQHVMFFNMVKGEFHSSIRWIVNPKVNPKKCPLPHPPKPQNYAMNCGSGS